MHQYHARPCTQTHNTYKWNSKKRSPGNTRTRREITSGNVNTSQKKQHTVQKTTNNSNKYLQITNKHTKYKEKIDITFKKCMLNRRVQKHKQKTTNKNKQMFFSGILPSPNPGLKKNWHKVGQKCQFFFDLKNITILVILAEAWRYPGVEKFSFPF